jgi:hypothetical protein
MEISAWNNIPLTYLTRGKKEGLIPASTIVEEKRPTKVGRRVNYTKRFRQERNLLNILENTFSKTFSYREYRANRYLYYKGIPALSRLLTYSIDRQRIHSLERTLYDQLLSYRFKSVNSTELSEISLAPGRTQFRKPNRLWITFLTDPTIDYGPAKL